jgi:hypothetical protein
MIDQFRELERSRLHWAQKAGLKMRMGRQCLSPTYYAVAKRPNALGALRRSDSHADALPSIHCCASCCVTKPGI